METQKRDRLYKQPHFSVSVSNSLYCFLQFLFQGLRPARWTVQQPGNCADKPAGGVHAHQEAAVGVAECRQQRRGPGERTRFEFGFFADASGGDKCTHPPCLCFHHPPAHPTPRWLFDLALSSPQVRLRGGRRRSSRSGGPPGGCEGADEAAGCLFSPGYEPREGTVPEGHRWQECWRLPACSVGAVIWWWLLPGRKGTWQKLLYCTLRRKQPN